MNSVFGRCFMSLVTGLNLTSSGVAAVSQSRGASGKPRAGHKYCLGGESWTMVASSSICGLISGRAVGVSYVNQLTGYQPPRSGWRYKYDKILAPRHTAPHWHNSLALPKHMYKMLSSNSYHRRLIIQSTIEIKKSGVANETYVQYISEFTSSM